MKAIKLQFGKHEGKDKSQSTARRRHNMLMEELTSIVVSMDVASAAGHCLFEAMRFWRRREGSYPFMHIEFQGRRRDGDIKAENIELYQQFLSVQKLSSG